jgi:hypothetical protein
MSEHNASRLHPSESQSLPEKQPEGHELDIIKVIKEMYSSPQDVRVPINL